MRRLDHSAIFVLIAGTYTPMILLTFTEVCCLPFAHFILPLLTSSSSSPGLCTDFGTDLARCRYWSGSFRLLDIGAKESNRSPLCLLWMGGGLELEKFSGRTSWPSNCCDCRRRNLLFRGSNCVRDEGAGSMAKGVRVPRNFSRAYCAGCRVPLLCGLGTDL